MKKRILAVLMASVLGMSLAACGSLNADPVLNVEAKAGTGSTDAADEADTEESTTEAATLKLTDNAAKEKKSSADEADTADSGDSLNEAKEKIIDALKKAKDKSQKSGTEDSEESADADAKDEESGKKDNASDEKDGEAKGEAADSDEDTVVSAQVSGKTVTVVASESVDAVPDTTEINLGVTTTGDSAPAAQDENTDTVNTVIDKLKELGVDEEDIQTSDYNIYPHYDDSGSSIDGYTVSTTLRISGQDIADAGKLVSEGIKAGATDVNGINFSSSDYDSAYREALKAAVQTAKDKAETLAEAADLSLGDVVSITEGYQDVSARTQDQSIYMSSMKEAASDMSVMPGNLDVTATVTVTYELK